MDSSLLLHGAVLSVVGGPWMLLMMLGAPLLLIVSVLIASVLPMVLACVIMAFSAPGRAADLDPFCSLVLKCVACLVAATLAGIIASAACACLALAALAVRMAVVACTLPAAILAGSLKACAFAMYTGRSNALHSQHPLVSSRECLQAVVRCRLQESCPAQASWVHMCAAATSDLCPSHRALAMRTSPAHRPGGGVAPAQHHRRRRRVLHGGKWRVRRCPAAAGCCEAARPRQAATLHSQVTGVAG